MKPALLTFVVSPARKLASIASLMRYRVNVISCFIAYDPEAMQESKLHLDNVIYHENPYQCIDGADALVILTEWDEFHALDLNLVKTTLNEPIVIDLRNIYKPKSMRKNGFAYTQVG